MPRISKARKATPPTAPPTIAPVLDDLGSGVVVGVFEGGRRRVTVTTFPLESVESIADRLVVGTETESVEIDVELAGNDSDRERLKEREGVVIGELELELDDSEDSTVEELDTGGSVIVGSIAGCPDKVNKCT